MSNLPTTPSVNLSIIQGWKQSRFSPIKGLRPETLVRALDDFKAGDLRDAALLFQDIEDRDDTLMTVIPKRKGSVARQGWTILTTENSRKAEKQADALRYFYNNVTALDAENQDQQGGFRLLVRQMMDAVGKRFAVHELVWQPSAHGLSAQFRFVPLWFFENKSGKLRFRRDFFSSEGEELEAGGWMVTVGAGLMRASAFNYLFKIEPLKDWLIYSGRNGMPGVKGTTKASFGSPEWQAMEAAVASFAAEFQCLMNEGADIEAIDLSTSGELPYPKLVERMDRGLAALWRGADLSTISQADGMGASLQQEESDILLEDDIDMINETLNIQIDRRIIDYTFGADVEQLAYVAINAPDRLDEKAEQEKLGQAADRGLPIRQSYYAERLHIELADGADPDALVESSGAMMAAAMQPDPAPADPEEDTAAAANAALERVAVRALAVAQRNDFDELDRRLAALDEAQSADELITALESLQEQLPQIGRNALGGQLETLLNRMLADAVVQGAADEATNRPENA